MAHGIISNLARLAEIPVPTLWAYCHGSRRASPARAELLEDLTGVSRLAWRDGDVAQIQAGLSAMIITWSPQTGFNIRKPDAPAPAAG
jgi:hypothetical protein